jgi:hypothetical protein
MCETEVLTPMLGLKGPLPGDAAALAVRAAILAGIRASAVSGPPGTRPVPAAAVPPHRLARR